MSNGNRHTNLVRALAPLGIKVPRATIHAVVKAFYRHVAIELCHGNKVRTDIGTFFLKHRKGRAMSVAMLHGKDVKRPRVKSADYVKFRPSKALRNAIWAVRKPE